jgi:Arc/MetJ family transcription regulator
LAILDNVTTKTGLHIDRDLVASASAVLGTTGTTATIDAALRSVVERAARERLLHRVGSLKPEFPPAILTAWH